MQEATDLSLSLSLSLSLYLPTPNLKINGKNILQVRIKKILSSNNQSLFKINKQSGQCGSVVERRPMHQEVAGLILSQDTCPGCGPNPQCGACRRRPIDVLSHQCFYLSLPLTSSLSEINKGKTNFKSTNNDLAIKTNCLTHLICHSYTRPLIFTYLLEQ
uniref:Uncharacterized protein n=1 Tax=Molossus molossus TaxID=27622 RepID=A0A7J8J7K2_MOLMO|nr:hypothetical protein HJG59_009593 [Molossus molossus]